MVQTLKRDLTFLDQAYDQASLRDHARFADYRKRGSRTPYPAALHSFFRVPDSQIALNRSEHPRYDQPQFGLAMEDCFGDWTLVKRGGGPVDHERPWVPTWDRFVSVSGEARNIVQEGSWFFETPSGRRRICSLDTYCDERKCRFTYAYPAADESTAQKEFARLLLWIDQHHYLKNSTIRWDGERIDRKTQVTWEDVALAADVQRTIRENVQRFVELAPSFARNGVPNRRGLLLYGPPGNGKTLIGRILASTTRPTFMYVTAADAEDPHALRKGFALARRLKPAIVFLEDLDLYATDRRSGPDCRTLGEILAQLDGLADNDGLMVIATTNDLTAIEPALRERPSRFDVVVEIGPPEADARRKILVARLAKCAAPASELLDEAVARTDGFSAAQVQEAAWRIIQQAILAGSLTPDGLAQPTRRELEAALPGPADTPPRRRVGFATNGKPCQSRVK